MTKSECEIKIEKKIVKKKFKKSEEGRRLFLNELSVYLIAREKKIKYIPTLISYDIVKRVIVTENVGKALGEIPEEDWEAREKHLLGISKIYKGLEKYGLYHNDLRYKNIIWNKCDNKYYLIDFEAVSIKNREADGDFIIRNIAKKILKGKKTKKKYLNK